MNNYFLVILDSCRYDSMRDVWTTLLNIPRLGPLLEAHSFATWTHPAHLNFLTGRLPWLHESVQELRSGGKEYYDNLSAWERRLGFALDRIIDDDLDILPVVSSLGYVPFAIASAKPIGPGTLFARQFQRYFYVGRVGHTMRRICDVFVRECLPIVEHGPLFGILNASETHYPYFDGSSGHRFETRHVPSWQRRVTRGLEGPGPAEAISFSRADLAELKERQRSSVRVVDSSLEELFAVLPRPAFVTVTADHGDCLGESEQFLHGEVFDPTVLRVPFIEGLLED